MKKKSLFIIILLVTVLVFTVAFSDSDHNVQYLQTSPIKEEQGYYIINSKEELLDYFNKNDKTYNLEKKGFLELIEKYDYEYFKEKQLVITLFNSSGTNVKVKVLSSEVVNEVLYVNVHKILPQFEDCMFSGWHVLIELDKEVINDVEVSVK